MSKISAVVITYNEEKNIKRCLESLKFTDEIIVVDSGSSDGTVSIAKEYTQKVLFKEWMGFAKQREFACNQAVFDWVLTMDADEVVTADLAQEIKKRLNSTPNVDGFWIRRRSRFLGRWIEHAWQPDWVLRLFRKEKVALAKNQVHEKITLKGKAERLKGRIEHYPFANLSHNLRKLDKYTTLSALQMQGRRKTGVFLKLLFSPILGFFKFYILKQGFRDGIPGLILSVFHSFYVFNKYAKYWELENAKKET